MQIFRVLIFALLPLLISDKLFSQQDTLFYRNGRWKTCRITRTEQPFIYYTTKRKDHRLEYRVHNKVVAGIKYGNGIQQIFDPESFNSFMRTDKTPQQKLICFAEMFVGIGAAVPGNRFERHYLGAGFGVIDEQFIFSVKFIQGQEPAKPFGTSYFYKPSYPLESTQELLLMAGLYKYNRRYIFSISSGLALQYHTFRSNQLANISNPRTFRPLHSKSAGLPLELQIIKHWRYVGIGLTLIGVTSKVANSGAMMFTFKVGKMDR